jgi:peptidoglycan/xylan/chitin deacetylase (PgdA/CDA1 family)
MQTSYPVLALLFCAAQLTAADRQIAITFDDLPRGGDGGSRSLADIRAMTERLLRPFHEQKLPVIGFVNEGRSVDFGPEGMRQIFDLWLDMGADLGNHSYSHLNVNEISIKEYNADIVRGEPILRDALTAHGKTLRYYRHPFLHTGPTPKIRRQMQSFLDSHG